MRSACLALLATLAVACSGGGDNDQQKAKLATDLVQCRNDLSNLKEQLAEAKAELTKAQEAKACVLQPLDLKAANAGQAQGVTFTPHTDPEMEKCMAGTMEKWKFTTFQGDPVAFEQPVNLVAK